VADAAAIHEASAAPLGVFKLEFDISQDDTAGLDTAPPSRYTAQLKPEL
jgi:hypothetical protein